MFLIPTSHTYCLSKAIICRKLIPVLSLIVALLLPASVLIAQTQPSATPTPAPQAGGQQKQDTTGEAGGPTGDIGPMAVPKKKAEEPKKEEAPQAPKKVEGMPN